MNNLIRLWNVIFGLADSLTKTKELIDLGNARMETSLGLSEPTLKIIEVEGVAKPRKGKEAAAA